MEVGEGEPGHGGERTVSVGARPGHVRQVGHGLGAGLPAVHQGLEGGPSDVLVLAGTAGQGAEPCGGPGPGDEPQGLGEPCAGSGGDGSREGVLESGPDRVRCRRGPGLQGALGQHAGEAAVGDEVGEVRCGAGEGRAVGEHPCGVLPQPLLVVQERGEERVRPGPGHGGEGMDGGDRRDVVVAAADLLREHGQRPGWILPGRLQQVVGAADAFEDRGGAADGLEGLVRRRAGALCAR